MVALFVLLLAVPCIGQEIGDRVRVTMEQERSYMRAKTTSGKAISKIEGGLVIEKKNGEKVTIPYNEIAKLERRTEGKSLVGKGAFVGAGTLSGFGVLVGSLLGGDAPGKLAIYGVVTGGLLGAAIGATAELERWEAIPVESWVSMNGAGLRIRL